ncbi:hypothetical protein [Paenibacillus sp. sgz500958]|uniref:hypothetical protein n=1 Tax=Paenibacillus sp. sgz500958 TaxID=3242475 RepID=UPI0036D431DE
MTTSKLIIVAAITAVIISVVSSLIGIFCPILILNENQILYLFSTTAQVLAGIYGLTLTGFIFFRNELSREESDDDSLTEAIQGLKERYYTLLKFITLITVSTLLISNSVISIESNPNTFWNPILMNMGQSLFIVNLMVISYFIFDVISPKRIEKESKKIQKIADPDYEINDRGSLEEFLKNYNQLEYIIQKYGTAYQSQIVPVNNKNMKRLSNVRLAEFIYKSEKINSELLNQIINLITLRNSIIHGAEPIVSKNIEELSRKVLLELASALELEVV